MKKTFLFILCFMVLFSITFANVQKVNELNGNNYGYIQKVYKKGTNYYVTVDYIQLYHGKQGLIAAIEDNKCTISGYTKTQLIKIAKGLSYDKNGLPPKTSIFFTSNESGGNCSFVQYPPFIHIRNISKKLRTYKIDTTSRLFGYCANNKTGDISYGLVDFKNRYSGLPVNDNTPWVNFNPSKGKFTNTYYKLTLKNGLVIGIEQQQCLP